MDLTWSGHSCVEQRFMMFTYQELCDCCSQAVGDMESCSSCQRLGPFGRKLLSVAWPRCVTAPLLWTTMLAKVCGGS